MSTPRSPLAASSATVLLLFAGSGAAALIYEVVWQQLLQLVLGSSTISLGVLLAAFMGGMGAGSVLAPRLIDRRLHPLRVYAALEIGIGMCGLLLLWTMPLIERLYVAWGGQGTSGIIIRAGVAAACLLPPAGLMGATLPAISRWVSFTPQGVALLGRFYAGNIGGAIAGSLVAAFYLLRRFDMNVATYAACALNVLVAGVAWRLAAGAPYVSTMPESDRPWTQAAHSPGRARLAPIACIALSGFVALAAEVIWTRLLSLNFSATVYTFAIVLAVFLVGLGAGSAGGALVVRRTPRPTRALAWCQWLTIPALAWSAFMLNVVLPQWPPPELATIWDSFAVSLGRTALAILPGPLLWGASFPLALAAAGQFDEDPGRLVGRVYAANTAGAIAGALTASLVLVALMGTSHGQQVLMMVAAASAVLAWAADGGSWRRWGAPAVVAVALAATVPPLSAVLVGYGRHAAAWNGHMGEILYLGEGLHASIAVSRVADGVLNYHNAGKVQASSQPPDMRLQRMLGHLTTIVPRQPRKVLVIGCGAGVTAGAVAASPAVQEVTIVDIEPLVPQVARRFFGEVNHHVLENSKVRVITDDARHFLMTTDQTFDAITSDPLDPWVKGAATLYTREFFETAKRHLNPGGVMTLFVQLYESSHETVQSEMATFFEAFPGGLVFGNTFEGRAIDTVLVGQVEPMEIYLDYIDEALRQPAFRPVADSLSQIGFSGAVDLFGNYAGRARDLGEWLEGAQLNRDRNLRLQYLAGMGVNFHEGDAIYGGLLQYRRFPDDLFIASESTLWRLQQAMEGTRE